MSLSEIAGQNKVIEILHAQFITDKIAHAYIFAGPEGVGKTKTALELAKLVNCRNPVDNNPCDACNSCNKINKNIHPDVHLVDFDWQMKMLEEKNPATRIKIETIQLIQKEINLKPFEGRYRAVIINQAERLNVDSANCLLKTIEEPPAYSLLILVTTTLESLPKTIISRCQKLRFAPLSGELIKSIVPDIPDNLLYLANGSAHKAIILKESLEDNYGINFVMELWGEIKSNKMDLIELLPAISGIGRNKEKLDQCLVNLLYLAREEMVGSSNEINNYAKMINLILTYRKSLRYNVSGELLLNSLLLELKNISEGKNICK